MTQPPAVPAATRAARGPADARRLLRQPLARPRAGRPARPPAAAALAVGLLAARRAAVPRPRARHLRSCCLRRCVRARRRRPAAADPFTLTCAGALLSLLSRCSTLRDAEWIAVLCVLAAAVLCVAGCRARPHASRDRAGRRSLWPLAGAARPALAGPHAPRRRAGSGTWPPVLRTVLVLAARLVVVFGLLFASADACSPAGSTHVVPDLTLDTLVLRVFVAVAVGGAVAGRGVRRPEPAAGRAAAPTGRRRCSDRYEWLVPVLLVVAVFVGFLVAQATAIVRRPRLPARDDRADLRRVRPPGLRPAHRRHRC